MRRLSLFVIGLILFSTTLFAADVKSLIRVVGLSKVEIRNFLSSDYDVPKIGNDFVEMVVSAQENADLKKAGRKLEVLIPDLDAYIAEIIRSQTPNTAYFSYETMTSTLKDWAQKYEKIARMSSIGKSFEGREIWAIKVSNNPDVDQKKPACLINGGHHAREWISVEVPMESLKQYLEGYGQDERITKLVNEHEVWFIPMVNPDGIVFSQTNTKYWRKNRRKIEKNYFGVDLNRNYGYKWGSTGSSDSPYSDTYHGTGPFSESETIAIKDLSDKEHFQASISFHSYSELVLYPFAYAYDAPCEDTPIFKKFSQELAAFNNYKPQNCTDLYPAAGISDDWFYGVHKTLAFTFELAQTFIPPVSEIAQVNKINVPAVFFLIEKSGIYAVNSPTGDPEIARNLGFEASMEAFSLAEKLMAQYSVEAKMKVAGKLKAAGEHVSEIVANDLFSGRTESWETVKQQPSAAFVVPMIKDRLLFEAAYGNFVRPEIFAEILSGK